MRIAVVINTSWNIYNFRMGLIKSLQQEGAEIYAIAPKDPFSDLLEQEGCHFIHLPMDGKGTNPIKDLALTHTLYRIYKKVRPDVVLQYTIKPNIYGSMAAAFLNIPVINNVSGLGTVFLTNTLSSRIARLLYKKAFKTPAKVFFQNPDDLQLFLKTKLVNDAITDVLPGSGIPVQHFQVLPDSGASTFTFLLVARLLIDKGIYEYIEAIRLLRQKGVQARFLLLGATDATHKRRIPEEELDQWIEEGLIEYLGTTKDVRPVLAQADCVVLPSYREGTPRTLLEAASCGKPLIATDVPGCNNIVDDRVNGFLCKVKDPLDLADKLQEMFELPKETRLKMGLNSRKKAEMEFDEKIVINHYKTAISKILNKKLELIG